MGRSVDYLNNNEYVIYFTADWINENEAGAYDEFLAMDNWEMFKENLISEITFKLKSYNECEKWDGRETQIFLENNLAEIGISEYCNLYSLSIRAKNHEFYNGYGQVKEGFAKHHCKQVRQALEKALINAGAKLLNRIGTFSNGVGVFERNNQYYDNLGTRKQRINV